MIRRLNSNVLNYSQAAEAGELKYPKASEAAVLRGTALLPCHLNLRARAQTQP